MNLEIFKIARNYSIKEYLENSGLKSHKKGRYTFFSSPFSSDSNPSFCVKENNRFIDYSTGEKGDIIDLVSKLKNITRIKAVEDILKQDISIIERKPVSHKKRTFNISKYLTESDSDIELIDKYAKSRCITYGYIHSKFFIYNEENERWEKKLAIGFIHRDLSLNICGIKMRCIDKEYKERFSARGRLMYYVLENIIDINPCIYIVESESSANSLHKILKKIGISFVIISFGSVSNVTTETMLPEKYNSIKKRYLIVDYDGNEEKYKERVAKYNSLNAEEIKLELPKGEDINSILCENKVEKIIKQIIKNGSKEISRNSIVDSSIS